MLKVYFIPNSIPNDDNIGIVAQLRHWLIGKLVYVTNTENTSLSHSTCLRTPDIHSGDYKDLLIKRPTIIMVTGLPEQDQKTLQMWDGRIGKPNNFVCVLYREKIYLVHLRGIHHVFLELPTEKDSMFIEACPFILDTVTTDSHS